MTSFLLAKLPDETQSVTDTQIASADVEASETTKFVETKKVELFPTLQDTLASF